MVLDLQESQHAVWPGQSVCGGLAWTSQASWKAEGRRFDPAPDHPL